MVASYCEVEHINSVWPVFLLKTAEFSSQLVVTNGPHPGVWPEVFIKATCALATSAFGLAPLTAWQQPIR